MLFFTWVSPLMATGAQRTLQGSDLLELTDSFLQPAECERTLWRSWQNVSLQKSGCKLETESLLIHRPSMECQLHGCIMDMLENST